MPLKIEDRYTFYRNIKFTDSKKKMNKDRLITTAFATDYR